MTICAKYLSSHGYDGSVQHSRTQKSTVLDVRETNKYSGAGLVLSQARHAFYNEEEARSRITLVSEFYRDLYTQTINHQTFQNAKNINHGDQKKRDLRISLKQNKFGVRFLLFIR